jgi:hypothetical protein
VRYFHITELLFGIFIITSDLTSSEFPKPYDVDAQINSLKQFMLKFSDRYSLQLVDGFEKEFLYSPGANSSDLSDIRFLYLVPKNQAYENEKSIILKYAAQNVSFDRSLFIHTSFNIPGQNFHFIPHKQIELKGQLYSASIWINSNNTQNSLSLLFKNASEKNVEVNIGKLNWNGWKRLEIQLPQSLQRRGKNFATRYKHSFTGFLLRSPTGKETSTVSLMIDNFLIISDTKEISYPGSEILDNWK